MLLAVANGDRATFTRVWQWTRANLQRPDGLLSSHWKDDHVVDPQSATDADIDAAHALIRASDAFGSTAYRDEAHRIAKAILELETMHIAGKPVVVAGPWALSKHVVNPSYLDLGAFHLFSTTFSEGAWDDVAANSLRIIRSLTDDGAKLPPDWATLDGSGRATAVAGPDSSVRAGTYGFDAARTPVRIACDDGGKRLLSRLATPLRATAGEGRAPVFLIGVAAAMSGAVRDSVFERARDEAKRTPTYYGAAWAALGPFLLNC